MDAREQRGLIIAALCKLNRKADTEWLPLHSLADYHQKCTGIGPLLPRCAH